MSRVEKQIRTVVGLLAAGSITQKEAVEELSALAAQGGSDEERMLFVKQYDSLADTLDGLVAAIEEFKGISGAPAELDRMMLIARRRFAIQLSATLFDEPFPLDTEAGLSASTSVLRLKGRFSRLADAVADLVETAMRDSKLRQELEIAGMVQRMLVPEQVVDVSGFVAHCWYRGAEQCSGDWWTLARAGRTDALLVIGDVTGHGAPAAIIVGLVRGALEMARLGMGQGLKPYMAMNMLNHILMDSVGGEYLMTAVVARYLPEARTLLVANAGHRSPWIVSGSGSRTIKGHRHAPLGTSRGQRYEDEEVHLGVGELLVAFTDGLVEATSSDGRPFGERALRAICEQSWAEGPEAICRAVRAAVEAHVGDLSSIKDDITFVVAAAPG